MSHENSSDVEEHNRFQRRYFERTVKRTMVPVDSRYLRRHVDEALKAGGIVPGQRVLEIGCGMGRYTMLLAREGLRIEGLDLSSVLLDRMREFNGGRFDIPLHCASADNPPAELEGAFDAVLGFFVLHHVVDLEGCFRGVARLLKPGGRAAFLEPNPLNPLYYVQILVTPTMTWQGERGILRMRQRLISDAILRAGLSQPRLSRFGFFPPFLANRPWGARLERALERVPLWRGQLPFQIFKAERVGG